MASTDLELCCASCGIAEVNEIKLKTCACKLVRYCSVKCQKEHRSQHKTGCKKRVAELRDEILFKQPESSHLGDCPICCLPLTLDPKNSMMMACCSKLICQGCNYANKSREMEERMEHKCAFCRKPRTFTQADAELNATKRIEANDPVAIREKGKRLCGVGDHGRSAFEYYTRAAGLGDATSHYQLSAIYMEGRCVEQNVKKAICHSEEAAIFGHPTSRHNLGVYELTHGRIDRAMKHFIIAANLGFEPSIVKLRGCYERGLISKEDFAAALRAHQAAVDATKSPQRETEAAERGKYVSGRGKTLYK